MDVQTIITDINKAVQIASAIASAVSTVEPGAQVAGVTLDKIVSVAQAAAAGSQDAADYIAQMQALAASTPDPTPEQWAALDTKTDADVAALEASTEA
ncbi:MAG: hypothetical protein WDM91_10825 [Rhizomicrobium sp.]